MFTVTSTGSEPQITYDVLQSVIKNYPVVAEYVIGNIDLHILTQPEIPTAPYNTFDSRTYIIKGAAIGLALGVLWILFYATMRQTVRSRKDIRLKLNQRCLAALPEVTFKKYKQEINREIIVTNSMISDGYLESFRDCRNSVLSALGDNKVILVTSTAPAEGKTSVAVNLAISLAKMKKRVVIIDGDLHNPSVARRLCGKDKHIPVSGKQRINMFKPTLDSNIPLAVMQFNAGPGNQWDVLNYDYLSGIINTLRNECDYIVIDTSPIGLTSAPTVFSTAADTAILVVK